MSSSPYITPFSRYQQNLTITQIQGPIVDRNPFSNLMTPNTNPYPTIEPYGWNPNPWNPWNPVGGGGSGGGSNGPVLPNAPRNFEFDASAVSALLNEADTLGNDDGELSKSELNTYIRKALRSGREDGTRLTTQDKQILSVVRSKFDNIADSKISLAAGTRSEYVDNKDTIRLSDSVGRDVSDVTAATSRDSVGSNTKLTDEDLAKPAPPPAPPAPPPAPPEPPKVVVENGNQKDTSTGSGANYDNKDDSDQVTIGSGSSNNVVNTSTEGDTITVSGSFQTVNSGAGNDTLTIDGTAYGSVNAGDGDDTLTVKDSGAYWTTLEGGEGNDTVKFEMSSTEFHVRDDGYAYGFVRSNGYKTMITKDVENFTFSDGKTLTKAELDAAIANNQGNLAGDSVQNDATEADTLNGGSGSLNLGTQLNDTITTNGNVTTVKSGAGNDTVTVNGGFHNTVDAGDGDDAVTADGDWGSGISLGTGNDTLHLKAFGGGWHDGGEGDDTLVLEDTQFTVSQSGNNGFVIRGKKNIGASSGFYNFETLKLGDQTFTAEELTAKITESGGKLLLGEGNTGGVTTGTDAADTLTMSNGASELVNANGGDDTLNLSGWYVTGNGGDGNDVFNLTNSRGSWNRVVANGGAGDDVFNVADNANRSADNLHALSGGEGNDTANFAMNADQYRVREVTGNAVTLVDIDSGALTQLTDVETLKFKDGKQYTLQELQTKYNQAPTDTLSFKSFQLGFESDSYIAAKNQFDNTLAQYVTSAHGSYNFWKGQVNNTTDGYDVKAENFLQNGIAKQHWIDVEPDTNGFWDQHVNDIFDNYDVNKDGVLDFNENAAQRATFLPKFGIVNNAYCEAVVQPTAADLESFHKNYDIIKQFNTRTTAET